MQLHVLFLAGALMMAVGPALGEDLEVFQNLEEVTGRIPNLKAKPFAKLIEANGGFFQSEIIIFKDAETGNEVWALSREDCMDMAHTGRRPAWSCDGRLISFKSNMVFLNAAEGNKLWQRGWAGYTYVANADSSKRRPLYGTADGKVRKFNCAKYNAWDAKRPGVWYTIDGDALWRLTIGDELTANKAEAVFKFPNAQSKAIQEVGDDNYMLIEEAGASPNCYVVDLNKEPKDPKFCLTAPLKGEVHSGSFRIHRTKPIIVTGGYENRSLGGVCYRVDEAKGLVDAEPPKDEYKGKIEMAHLWYGPPDDRVGFFGKYDGKSGLYLHFPGKAPVLMADVPDGHVTWCGRDPEWFFAAVGPGSGKDAQYIRKLLACNIDGKTVKIVCTPFDRRRPGPSDYSSIPLPTESRDGTKCWFHSSVLLDTNKNTGSYIAVFRRPYAPTELKLKAGAAVEIEWTQHAVNNEVKGFHVYRSDDDGKTYAEMTDKAVEGKSYLDKSALAGKTYLYAVTAEEWSRLESDTTSPRLKVEVASGGAKSIGAGAAVKAWDKTAPAAIKELTATLKDGLIVLKWPASADKDLRYYNIYASASGSTASSPQGGKPEITQKRLLVSPPHDETSYIDWSAPKGKTINYAITAIDRQGNESAPAFATAIEH